MSEKVELVLKNCKYVNVFTNEVLEDNIAIHEGKIVGFGTSYKGAKTLDLKGKTVIPSFIGGHIHIESTMLSPYNFIKAVLPHGTTAVVADDHEIVNVLGSVGMKYMIESTEGMPVDVFFMLPSCVPAVPGDENGAQFTVKDIAEFLPHERVLGLGEVMNFVGLINDDKSLLKKITLTKKADKRIDGHAPDLLGAGLDKYICAGVGTDHECTTEEEAMEKLRKGMWIMIREGSAAKNMTALKKLLKKPYCNHCVLVTDDKHADDLYDTGHVDYLVRLAISRGADPIDAIKMASYNTAQCFEIENRGAIAPGYDADLIVTTDINKLDIVSVFKNGKQLYSKGKLKDIPEPKLSKTLKNQVTHTFNVRQLQESDFTVPQQDTYEVIELVPGEIVTRKVVTSNVADCVKLAVIERHKGTGHVGRAYLKGYGLKRGAIATSIAHDSHNLVVAGCNERDMLIAAGQVIKNGGGLAIADDGKVVGELPLPIAGLMTDAPVDEIRAKLKSLRKIAEGLGIAKDIDPFMNLSFVCLPVIPEIRLTTKGIVKL